MKDGKKTNINKQRYEAEGHPVEGQQSEAKKDKVKSIANKVVGAATVAGGALSAGVGTMPFINAVEIIDDERKGITSQRSARFLKVVGAGLIAGGALSAYTGIRTARRKD